MVSKVPAALAALTSMAVAALTGWQVVDGQPVESEPDFCAIGWDSEQASVAAAESPGSVGGGQRQELFDVSNTISSWRGDPDPSVPRQRVYDGLEAFAAALNDDPTLGGAVARAQLSTSVLAQEQDPAGPIATIRFTVHIEAWR